MRKKNIFESLIIIFIFVAIVLAPYIVKISGVEGSLFGAVDKEELTWENIDNYVIQNFPGREYLIKARNQFLYSVFNMSPNENIVKINDTLIASESLNNIFHGESMIPEKDVEALIEKLNTLDELCKKKNKKLVVVTTPTKARYHNGNLSFADDIILAYQGETLPSSYELFKNKMKKSNIYYFDCIDYIDENKEKLLGGDIPLFYKTSHHWSSYKGSMVGLGLKDFFKTKVGIRVPEIELVTKYVDEPQHPDADLYKTLNLINKPKEDFCTSNVKYLNYDNDDLQFLIQGGSFGEGLIIPYFTIGVNADNIHISNKSCFYDRYMKNFQFEDYDDLDKRIQLRNKLKDFDVILLEMHELNIKNATFGFIDYLLKNKEYF